MSAAVSRSPTRAATNAVRRSRVSAQRSSSSLADGLPMETSSPVLTNVPLDGCRTFFGASIVAVVRLRQRGPHRVDHEPRSNSMESSRLQLALNVSDIDAATRFYSDLFGV